MVNSRKRLVSGVKPTGRPHIGNYFGAMKQFVELQEDYDSFYFVANYHALTTEQKKDVLEKDTLGVVIDYLAIGLDPEKSTIFLQSDVPEVTELAWIFNNLVTVPYLERAHAYKDAVSKGKEANAGLFTYPVLMASDILMYDADVVPVGEDQKQHVEIAREIARKFNLAFGDVFKEPKELIVKEVATVLGTDGQKMSKSYGNTIPLFAPLTEIEKAVMSIPTDSKGVNEPKDPENDNVFTLHKLFAGDRLNEIREGYEKGGLSYADSKKMLIEEIDAFIEPLRSKRDSIKEDTYYIKEVLENGRKRAKEIASEKMDIVREIIGLKI